MFQLATNHELRLVCTGGCGRRAQFMGDTRLKLFEQARRDGWWIHRCDPQRKAYCRRCRKRGQSRFGGMKMIRVKQ